MGAREEQAMPCAWWWFEAVLHPGAAVSLSGYVGCLDPSLLLGHWKEKGGLSEHKEDFRLGAISSLVLGDVVPPPWPHEKLKEDPL